MFRQPPPPPLGPQLVEDADCEELSAAAGLVAAHCRSGALVCPEATDHTPVTIDRRQLSNDMSHQL